MHNFFLFELRNSHIKTNTYTHTFVPTPTVTASHKREKFLLSLNILFIKNGNITIQKTLPKMYLSFKSNDQGLFVKKQTCKIYGKIYFLDIIVVYSPLQGCSKWYLRVWILGAVSSLKKVKKYKTIIFGPVPHFLAA